ncbi:MAG: ABC transporter permease [Dehalococcoidia bacterium]
MKELFGIPTFNIMLVLVALLGLATATVLTIGLSNRTMFRMGLRNLPRRGLQTGLVIAGLALATLITTAAFVTGDTIDHSLTADSEELFGRSDLDITWNGERDFVRDAGASTEGEQVLMTAAGLDALEGRFAGDPQVDVFLPFVLERAPVTDARSGIAVGAAQLVGVDIARLGRAGGLTMTNGSAADLSALASGSVLLSERAAGDLDARTGDTVILHVRDIEHAFQVAGIVRNEITSGVLGLSYSSVPGGVVVDIETLRMMYGLTQGEMTSITVALAGDDRREIAPSLATQIQVFIEGEGSGSFVTPDGASLTPQVFSVRSETLDQAELTGNTFTTIFLVLGLFSMAAGIILIFMIFVMLAAERRAEMGMARAVGAKRSHLVQAFIVEGMAYSLLAGFIGVATGVGASLGLTVGLLPAVGGEYFSLVEPKVTWVAVVIGYSLGVVITFITVVAASVKVSRVNIVAAIRDLPEERTREAKRQTRWRWVAAGIPALVVPPLGIWLLLRKGFGLPGAWILTPSGLAIAALCILVGKSSDTLFFFSLGVSLLPLSAAALASYYGVRGRPLWSAVGALLALYWLMPPHMHDRLFGEFTSDMEMFVLSGIMIVVGFTLVIVFNARVLTAIFGGASRQSFTYFPAGALLFSAALCAGVAGVVSGDLGQLLYLPAGILAAAAGLAFVAVRFPSTAPALKMAVAYPLANRFRTGMTIAMFSIIMFSLTVFSVLLANFDAAFLGGDARANLDIVGTGTSAAAVKDLASAIGGTEGVEAVGLVTLPGPNQAVGQVASADETSPYPILAADDAFFGDLETTLESFANGFASEAEVLAAVRDNTGLALVDATVIDGAFNDSYEWVGGTATVADGRFEPFEVSIINTATGKTMTVTVVGTLKLGLPSSTIAGVYLNEATYMDLFGAPSYQRFYIRLTSSVDAEATAVAIESAYATTGIEADSITGILDAMAGQNNAFSRMFQAFMALGLFVGISGLGVIAFRSVVERRQQIGMLRAIGYQRATVTLAFLMESSFIAVMGIGSGVVGGAILARNLLTSKAFTDGAEVPFSMPWDELLIFVGVSFAFSLLMTWWPSQGASRVPVADALRYE